MLDTTVCGIESNSYVTVEFANTYFNLHSQKDFWDEIPNKEALLVQATDEIDNFTFDYSKLRPNQSLEFPRSNNIADNTPYIPLKIKKACCEQALFLHLNPDRWIHQQAYSNKLKSVDTGVDKFLHYDRPDTLSVSAYNLLTDYLSLSWEF